MDPIVPLTTFISPPTNVNTEKTWIRESPDGTQGENEHRARGQILCPNSGVGGVCYFHGCETKAEQDLCPDLFCSEPRRSTSAWLTCSDVVLTKEKACF